MSTAEVTEPQILSSAAQMGSDHREHHRFGFSFLGTLERCPAARRADEPAKNLVEAAERGIELHKVLEETVIQWIKNIQLGAPIEFTKVATAKCFGLHPDDQRSVMRIVAEIAPNFIAEEGIVVGTEEKLNLRDPRTGEVRSFGWYDILLKREKTAFICDNKFVRKEVDSAEKNRQGHALAVGVFQEYPDVDTVVVLFAMPECTSSLHTFTRAADFERLQTELIQILDNTDEPAKILSAGEHCVYCKFRGRCPATIGALKTIATAVEPLSVPSSFDVSKIESPEQIALLKYWCSVIDSVSEKVNERAMQLALAGAKLRYSMGGEIVEYKLFEKKAPRAVKDTVELYHAFKWVPIEALLSACRVSLGKFEQNALQVLTDRLLSQGKEPIVSEITRELQNVLLEKGLVERNPAPIQYLKRTKVTKAQLLDESGELPSTASDDK